MKKLRLVTSCGYAGVQDMHTDWGEFDSEEDAEAAKTKAETNDNNEALAAALEDHNVEFWFEVVDADEE